MQTRPELSWGPWGFSLCHEMSVLWRVHLTTGLCDQSSHTQDKMSQPGEGQVDILFDRRSASQPAYHLQLASQPAMWKKSTCQSSGWSDSWWQEDREPEHTGPQSRSPELPLVPLGEWPTWPRPSKWHMSSAACYIPLALCWQTVCSFVSTSPNHIFLHTM